MSSSSTTPHRNVSALARPSGGFAMLAVDQREAMRAMFAQHQSEPVPDEQVAQFKLTATRILSPHASAVLLDKQFVLDRAIAEKVVDRNCALIAAADRFIPSADQFVSDVEIDTDVDPIYYRQQGTVAMKLLVIYRPDGQPATRITLVETFLDRCHSAGLISIIEPISRPPLDGSDWAWDEGGLAAARELGGLGADLYKAEVPHHGKGARDDIRRRCATLTETIDSPWVVLSSGVRPETFPEMVELACSEGASGFLAGRAVWQPVIGSDDVERDLQEISVARLKQLGDIVDAAVASR